MISTNPLGCIGEAILGDMNPATGDIALAFVLVPPDSCKCLVLHTKIPPLSTNIRECRKAKLLYKCLISPPRPACGPSTTLTTSFFCIVFCCESRATAFLFSRRFVRPCGLASTTFPCMESTWKFSRSNRTITPTVCASSCTKSPH